MPQLQRFANFVVLPLGLVAGVGHSMWVNKRFKVPVVQDDDDVIIITMMMYNNDVADDDDDDDKCKHDIDSLYASHDIIDDK